MMSEKTIDELCGISKKCSGCQLNNLYYDEQLRLKQSKINKLFYGIIKPEKIVPSPCILRYRNKASAVFFEDRNKRVRWGVYQSAEKKICAAEKCLLQPTAADEIFADIASLIKSCKIKVYDPSAKTGLMRSAVLRFSDSGGIMLVLVTTDGEFRKELSFVNAIMKKHPEITCVIRSFYTGDAVLMTGEEEKILWGEGFIEDEMLGRKFRISAHSFYQINSRQTAALYKKAIELAALDGTQTFLDAYCGTGTIGIIAAQCAKCGTGVELNRTAVADAKENAALNGADNIEFYCGDAGEYLKNCGRSFNVVFTDPPRAGCGKTFLKSLAQAKPAKIIYISCNPETQVRDVGFLLKNGYKISKAVPFDMFPQTGHVETVVLLSQRRADEHIDIKLDLTDLDLTTAEAKATYNEIKAYVLEQYGVKVSSLYISQVKRKLGLEVGESFNKPKTENAKQPQCPQDKEKTIIKALKHFKMIENNKR